MFFKMSLFVLKVLNPIRPMRKKITFKNRIRIFFDRWLWIQTMTFYYYFTTSICSSHNNLLFVYRYVLYKLRVLDHQVLLIILRPNVNLFQTSSNVMLTVFDVMIGPYRNLYKSKHQMRSSSRATLCSVLRQITFNSVIYIKKGSFNSFNFDLQS